MFHVVKARVAIAVLPALMSWAYQDAAGYIFLTDRKKDMIITGGFNVYPKEIEEVLYTHPAVFECAVIGVPHSDWGEAVEAVVVLRQGARASAAELLDFCRQHLSAFKRPKSVKFAAEIPRNPSESHSQGHARARRKSF